MVLGPLLILPHYLGTCFFLEQTFWPFSWAAASSTRVYPGCLSGGVTLESLQKPHSNSKATLAVDYGGLRVNVPVTDSGHGCPPCRKDTSLSPAPAVPLALASAQLHEFMSDVSPSRPASLAPLAFSLFPSTPAPLHWQALMHAAPSP